MYYEVLELCPTSVFIVNEEGQIVYANKKAETLLKLSKEEITQRMYNAPEWVLTDFEGNSLPEEEHAFYKVMTTEEPVDDLQSVLEWPNGERRYISVNAIPTKNEDGTLNGMIATVEDITKEIATKNELREYHDLFTHLLDEVHLWKVIKNKKRQIVNWELIDANPAALKSWNVKRREVVGKTASEIFGGEAITQFMPVVQKIFSTGKPYGWEEYFAPTNQTLSMHSIPLGDRFISTGRDVTAIKLAERKLIEAKEKAEEASQLKTDFLKNISHEIRTPMNGIIGFSDLLANSETTEEQRRNYGDIIKSSGQQLLRVINDIIDISVLDKHQEEITESTFCLNELLSELYAIFKLGSSENQVPIRLKKGLNDAESTIVSDKSRLYKIMRNLIENAIKFTHEGAIDFGYTKESNELVLYVKDTGIGIDAENLEIIFERFAQEKKGESKFSYGGLGLGLSISKQSAELMGGNITVKSEKGKGSTFYVKIPYKIAPQNV